MTWSNGLVFAIPLREWEGYRLTAVRHAMAAADVTFVIGRVNS